MERNIGQEELDRAIADRSVTRRTVADDAECGVYLTVRDGDGAVAVYFIGYSVTLGRTVIQQRWY